MWTFGPHPRPPLVPPGIDDEADLPLLRCAALTGCSVKDPWKSTGKEGMMIWVVAQSCVDVKDKACMDACPVDCIYEGERMVYIRPDECIGCGACEPVCPTQAIYYEDDLPSDQAEYLTINAEFFDHFNKSGGAMLAGRAKGDHPAISAMPVA